MHFAELCAILSDTTDGDVVFLDFVGVKAVNGSWLNAAIGELFRWASEERNNVFPILIHFPTEDLDELELVAQINEQAYPVSDKPETPPRAIRLKLGRWPHRGEPRRKGAVAGSSASG